MSSATVCSGPRRAAAGAAHGFLGDADAAALDLTAADALAARIVDEVPAAAALRRDVVRERASSGGTARRRRREKAAFAGRRFSTSGTRRRASAGGRAARLAES